VTYGSWVTWVMGQKLNGSLGSWVTLSDPFPAPQWWFSCDGVFNVERELDTVVGCAWTQRRSGRAAARLSTAVVRTASPRRVVPTTPDASRRTPCRTDTASTPSSDVVATASPLRADLLDAAVPTYPATYVHFHVTNRPKFVVVCGDGLWPVLLSAGNAQ